MMRVVLRVERLDNDLVIRLPDSIAEQFNIFERSLFKLNDRAGQLELQFLGLNLDDLVSQITPENRHPETDFGPPQGNEVW